MKNAQKNSIFWEWKYRDWAECCNLELRNSNLKNLKAHAPATEIVHICKNWNKQIVTLSQTLLLSNKDSLPNLMKKEILTIT